MKKSDKRSKKSNVWVKELTPEMFDCCWYEPGCSFDFDPLCCGGVWSC